MASQKNNYKFTIREKIPVSAWVGASFSISKDLELGATVEVSNASITFMSETSIERFIGTCTADTFTIVLRWLEQWDTNVANAALKKDRPAWSEAFVTVFAWDILDVSSPDPRTITTPLVIDNLVFTATGKFCVPRYADDAARDSWITLPIDGMIIYHIGKWLHQKRVGWAWVDDSGGAIVANGSETVAGKFELSTPVERWTATSIWGTWARLVVANDALIKTPSWTPANDENKIPVLNASGLIDPWFIDPSALVVNDKVSLAGENIAADKFVCRLWDGKLYEIANNERITMWSISWQTSARSHELPNDKIVTICQTGNTLTAFVGTINRALNTVTYWSGYTITTQAQVWVYSVSDNWTTDSFVVVWWRTTGNILECVANTISWTVVTTGSPSTLNTNTAVFPSVRTSQMIDSIWNGKCVCVWAWQASWYTNVYARVISVSWTTITLWSETAVLWWGWSSAQNGSVVSMWNDKFYMAWENWTLGRQESSVCTVSWTTITAWTIVNVVGASNRPLAIATDRANNVYAIDTSASGKILYAYSVSGTTQTSRYSTSAFASTPIWVIVTTNNVLGIVFASSITWWIEDWNSFVSLNTETYTRPLANFGEQTYSTHYFMWTESWNPTRIFKVANEIRNVYWYTVAAINRDAAWNVIRFGEVTTWITNIPVWLPLYVDKSNGRFTAAPRLVQCGNARANNRPFIDFSL